MGLRGLLGCLRPATFKAVDTPLNSENPSGVSQEPAASAFIANVAVPDEVGASEVADQRRSQSLELAKSSSGQRLLLLGSNTDWGQEKQGYRQRLSQFHETRRAEGHVETTKEMALLEDITLLDHIGQGAFAACYKAIWQGGTQVACKLMVSTPEEVERVRKQMIAEALDKRLQREAQARAGAATGAGAGVAAPGAAEAGAGPDPLATSEFPPSPPASASNTDLIMDTVPAAALAEAIIGRNLNHPNIVPMYTSRCARVSPEFFAAVAYGQCPTDRELLEYEYDQRRVGLIPDLYPPPRSYHQAPPPVPGTRRPRFGEPGYTPSSPFIAAVRAIVDGWRGCTPLHPRPARGGSSDTQEASGVPSGYVSADGFGSPEDEVGRPAGFCWSDLMIQLGLGPNSYLTIFVMEYARYGSLEKAALKKGFFNCVAKGQGQGERHLKLRALLRTCTEVAKALVYLESYGIVHGDLKPSNILMQTSRIDARGFHAMLSDFGLAHVLQDSAGDFGSRSGTPAYMAPELLKDGKHSHSGDIYALGITMHVLATGQPPYKDVKATPALVCLMVQMNKLRPQWPNHPELERLGQLFTRCVAHDPAERPTAIEVMRELVAIEVEVRDRGCRAASAPSSKASSKRPGSS